jgi:hypothetical protein
MYLIKTRVFITLQLKLELLTTTVGTGHNVTCADITKDVQKGCSA